jgi:hypothetical protein
MKSKTKKQAMTEKQDITNYLRELSTGDLEKGVCTLIKLSTEAHNNGSTGSPVELLFMMLYYHKNESRVRNLILKTISCFSFTGEKWYYDFDLIK